MKHLLVLALFLITGPLSAAEKHSHREHGAHVHGAAELSVAFDGPQGKIEFKSPSESVFGFEHAAKTAADKKAVDDAFKKFETNIAEMISFEKSLECQFSKEKIEVVFEGKNHSNTAAAFTVRCNKSPVGTKLQFNIQKHFPKIKDIDAQILADSVQKSVEIKSSGTSAELK